MHQYKTANIALKFLASVEDGLKPGQLTNNIQNEFIRDVCTAILNYTRHPSKAERIHVARLIVKQYLWLIGGKNYEQDEKASESEEIEWWFHELTVTWRSILTFCTMFRDSSYKLVNGVALLQYHINSGEEKEELEVGLHGNSCKSSKAPFNLKAKSTLQALKQKVVSNAPSQAYKLVCDQAGGSSEARQPKALPCSRKQVYDLQFRAENQNDPVDDLLIYARKCEKQIVLRHKDVRTDLWVLGTKVMCNDLGRFTSSEKLSHPIFIDPTFNMGQFKGKVNKVVDDRQSHIDCNEYMELSVDAVDILKKKKQCKDEVVKAAAEGGLAILNIPAAIQQKTTHPASPASVSELYETTASHLPASTSDTKKPFLAECSYTQEENAAAEALLLIFTGPTLNPISASHPDRELTIFPWGGLTILARRLCTEYVDPISIEAVLSNRLIPLDKGEGAVRPICVGEVLRRIIGKCVMKVIESDVIKASGSLQVCAGLKSGSEAAIHAMRNIYEADETDRIRTGKIAAARQTGKRTDRQTGKWTDRQTDKETGRLID
ncbi:hypothetical protein ACROYT_G015065 [Oculina patagonica]